MAYLLDNIDDYVISKRLYELKEPSQQRRGGEDYKSRFNSDSVKGECVTRNFSIILRKPYGSMYPIKCFVIPVIPVLIQTVPG